MPTTMRKQMDELLDGLAELRRASGSADLRTVISMITAADEALSELQLLRPGPSRRGPTMTRR
jgi:hypothetical protein